jgi:hypothetical protein
MNILKEHLRINAALIAAGKPPREYPRYVEGPYKGDNRQQRRAHEAQMRFKADTPHGKGKKKPRHWRRRVRIQVKRARRQGREV